MLHQRQPTLTCQLPGCWLLVQVLSSLAAACKRVRVGDGAGNIRAGEARHTGAGPVVAASTAVGDVELEDNVAAVPACGAFICGPSTSGLTLSRRKKHVRANTVLSVTRSGMCRGR
jgi:hypothetical protein